MAFTSLAFLVFLSIFYPAYRLVLRRTNLRILLVLAASVVFYGWWDWRFLFLIFVTGGVDFCMALAMTRFSRESVARRLCVAVSLLSGIGVLSVFKYSAFFADALSALLSVFGVEVSLTSRIPAFCLILPVGISFYTFQSLSYTIDVYRGELKPTRDPFHFFAYLMLFPQLVAGPIIRASDLLWRLKEEPKVTAEGSWDGIRLCVVGLAKKCLIADNLAHYVDLAFANVMMESHSSFWWMTMVAFAVQIYCDFSGYSDMARGLIRLLGYQVGLNFDHPCLATGPRDFWRRWHISLSSWFRDYVYLPLGGGRGGRAKGVRNVWIVFLLSGLWHGAGWNFVAWGGVHALWLTIERLVPYQDGLRRLRLPGAVLGWLVAQMQVVSAWAFFRAESIPDAWHIVRRMFAFHDFSYGVKQVWAFLLMFAAIELWGILGVSARGRRRFARFALVEAAGLALLAAAAFWFRGRGHAFIYFQF